MPQTRLRSQPQIFRSQEKVGGQNRWLRWRVVGSGEVRFWGRRGQAVCWDFFTEGGENGDSGEWEMVNN